MTKILETERLIIREFGYDDIPLLIRYSKEKTRKKELPDEIFDTEEKATTQIKMFSHEEEQNRFGCIYTCRIYTS